MDEPAAGVVPIVVDLGRTRRKRIKRLKRGRGPLVGEVAQVVEQVKASLGDAAADKELVPVVLLYRGKRRRRKGGLFPFF